MVLRGTYGVMTILIRVINPAFPEGIMLAILFANVFAPLIDYFVVEAMLREGATFMNNDSILKTFVVAFLLCVVCSVLVSGSAVSLKPMHKKNAELDIKKNLLLAMKLLDNPKASESEIMSQWANVKEEVINLETGEVVTDIDPATFDQRNRRKIPKQTSDSLRSITELVLRFALSSPKSIRL